MGYISTAEVKAIREEIKKVLTTKDGFKLSIKREHYYGVRIALMQSPLELESYERSINDRYLERIECKNTRTIFELVQKAINRVMGANYDRNAGDPGADYCNYRFYQTFRIGEYDKPCTTIKGLN